MSIVEMVLDLGGAAFAGFALYLGGGGYIPFAVALSAVRIRERNGAIELATFDADAMGRSGFVLWALPGFALPWGWTALISFAFLLVVFWFSFRMRVVTTADKVVIERKLLWAIPYRRRTVPGPPSLIVDGWGDMVDPEGLTLVFPDDLRCELGWSLGANVERAERLAKEFNAKVAALRR